MQTHNHSITLHLADGTTKRTTQPCNKGEHCPRYWQAPTLRCKVKPIAVAQPHGFHEPIWVGGNAARLACIEDIRKVYRPETEDRAQYQLAHTVARSIPLGLKS